MIVVQTSAARRYPAAGKSKQMENGEQHFRGGGNQESREIIGKQFENTGKRGQSFFYTTTVRIQSFVCLLQTGTRNQDVVVFVFALSSVGHLPRDPRVPGEQHVGARFPPLSDILYGLLLEGIEGGGGNGGLI